MSLARRLAATALLLAAAAGSGSAATSSLTPTHQGLLGTLDVSSGAHQSILSGPYWEAQLLSSGLHQLYSGFLSLFFGASSSLTGTPGQDLTQTVNTPAGPVTVTIPAGAVAEGAAVTVRVPVATPGATRPDLDLIPNTAVEIVSAAEPSQPITVSISFANSSLIGRDPERFVLTRFDPNRQQWAPLFSEVDTAAKTVTAKVRAFSILAIAEQEVAASVGTALVSPSPFRRDQGHTTVNVALVPPGSRVRIFTMNGQLVREFSASASGMVSWDLRNQSGQKVSSGIYYGVAESGSQRKTFKIGIQN